MGFFSSPGAQKMLARAQKGSPAGSQGVQPMSPVKTPGVKGKLVNSQDFIAKPITGYGHPSQSATPK